MNQEKKDKKINRLISLFTNGDPLYAFNEDGEAYYPHLVSEVSSDSILYSNDITIDASDFSQTSDNTNFEGSFTQNREVLLTNDGDSIISESGDYLITESFRDPINMSFEIMFVNFLHIICFLFIFFKYFSYRCFKNKKYFSYFSW